MKLNMKLLYFDQKDFSEAQHRNNVIVQNDFKEKKLKYVVIDHNAFNQAQYMIMLSIREEFLKFTSNLPPAKREKLLENLDRYILSDLKILTGIFSLKNSNIGKFLPGMATDGSVRRSSEPCST